MLAFIRLHAFRSIFVRNALAMNTPSAKDPGSRPGKAATEVNVACIAGNVVQQVNLAPDFGRYRKGMHPLAGIGPMSTVLRLSCMLIIYNLIEEVN